MSAVENKDEEPSSSSADLHDVDLADGSTAQGSSAESITSVHTAREDFFRLEDLTLEKATDLGYPTEQTFEQSFGSGISSEDLEKGVVAPVLVQQQLGAHDYEKSDALPVMRKDPDTATSYRISLPPDQLPKLPHKRDRRMLRGLRYNLLAVYQRLFSVVFIGNMIAFIIGVVLHRHSHPFGPTLGNLATAVAANVMGAILIRQEYIINSLYSIFCWTPLSMPLRFRRVVSKLYHFGGVHSGCAVSATAWFILYSALVTKRYADGTFNQPAVIAVTYLLLALFLALCVFAIPKFRIFSHNTFEAVHRFGGWTAVALFWVEILLVLHAESEMPGTDTFGSLVVQAPAFWFLLVVTFFTILPWIRLRKVEAFPEVLSKHAVRIHFKYSYKNIGNVIGLRITHNPMRDWHAFATIPDADGSSFSLIVSDNGDWTKKQIMEPAHSYWIRGIPVTGVLRMATVFRRIVLVTTGSGIGPCLSFLASHPMPCRLLWSTPNPVQTYGEDVMRAVAKADPEAMIIDTRASGRPDVVALTYHLYLETKAESVFIISNPYLTSKLVYGLESREAFIEAMSSNSGVACGFAGARGAQYAKVLVPLLSRMFGNQDGSHSLASSSTALSIFGCHPQFLTPSSLLKLLLIGAFSTALLAHRRIIKLAFASVTIGVAAYGSFRRIRYPDYSATVASKHVVGALISSSTGPAAVIIMSRRERFPLSMVT